MDIAGKGCPVLDLSGVPLCTHQSTFTKGILWRSWLQRRRCRIKEPDWHGQAKHSIQAGGAFYIAMAFDVPDAFLACSSSTFASSQPAKIALVI